jgi:hypothetical protein
MNKGILCKLRVRLLVEEFEARLAPAGILDYQTGAFTVANAYVDNAPLLGFQLSASDVRTSAPFQAPNGQWQVVQSTPNPFSYVRTPTDAEWNALNAPAFGDYDIKSSVFQLADNSFLIKDAEALGPDKIVAGPANRMAQSLFVRYVQGWPLGPLGGAPAAFPNANQVHWIQFVTTNYSIAGPNDVPNVDTRTGNPYYDETPNASANGSGFADMPSRDTRNALTTWHADLFLVQDEGLSNAVNPATGNRIVTVHSAPSSCGAF